MFGKILILGAGSWGATVGDVVSQKAKVFLWEKSEKKYKFFLKHRHPEFFPFIKMKGVTILNKLEIPDGTKLIFIATPAQNVREVLEKVKGQIQKKKIPLVILSKGIEIKTLKTMDCVVEEIFANHPYAIISGPSHAEEVAKRKPTSFIIASKKKALALKLQEFFLFPYLRPYTHTDVRGVALGGALKNVYAIAAGICDGMKLGINAKSALITRSLAEMIRIGTALGGKFHTFSGLSGVGDLITTCFSNFSRNRNLGEEIGKGRTLDEALKKVKTTAEGASTVIAVKKISDENKISAPIANGIYDILFKRKNLKNVIKSLMERPMKSEEEVLK